jgi:hypothetical protein
MIPIRLKFHASFPKYLLRAEAMNSGGTIIAIKTIELPEEN